METPLPVQCRPAPISTLTLPRRRLNMDTNSSNLTNAPHQVLPAAAKRRTYRGRGASSTKGTKTQNRAELAAVRATTSSKKTKNGEKENPNMFPTDDDTMLHMISFCGHVAVSNLLFVSHRFRKLVDARMKSIVDAACCLLSRIPCNFQTRRVLH